MMAWATLLIAVFKLLAAVWDDKKIKDAAEKKRKEDLREGWKEDLASRDLSRINARIDQLRDEG